MPRVLLTVPETQEGNTRPVIYDVAGMLFRYTGINPNTNIFFPGDLETGKQLGSYLNLKGDDPNFFAFNDKVSIEVTEVYEQDRFLNTAINQAENRFIFNDPALGVNIRPIYSSADMTVNFKYRAQSKSQAQRWRDEIRARFSDGRLDHVFSVTYHYLVPPEHLLILKEIHRLRENLAGYNESYDEYFQHHSTPAASELTNLNATAKYLGISETQGRINGWFDFDAAPEEGSKTENNDPWEISFNFRFRYDKAIACIMNYPIVIHNQVVSSKYRPARPAFDLSQVKREYSLSSGAFHAFEAGTYRNLPQTEPGLTIPAYDEYLPSTAIPYTQRVFNGLTLLLENHPRDLMNLADPGDYHFVPCVLQLLKTEAPYMTIPYASIFSLSVYQDNRIMDNSLIQVDNELNVTAKIDLNLRKQYRVRLAVVNNLVLLSQAAITRLCQNGCALNKILKLLKPSLPDITIIGNNQVSRTSLTNVISALNGTNASKYTDQVKNIHTVMTLTIQSLREDHATST